MDICTDCHRPIDETHTELACLRAQLAAMKANRDAWKEAWHQQRRATGEVAWWWTREWMRPYFNHTGAPTADLIKLIEEHVGLPPMHERHGCLGCAMVDGKCPHCGCNEGP